MSDTEPNWEQFIPTKTISDAAPESNLARQETLVLEILSKAFANGSQHPVEISPKMQEAAMLYAFMCNATIRQPFKLTHEDVASIRRVALEAAKNHSGLEGELLTVFENALPRIEKEAAKLVVVPGHGWGAQK